MRWTTTSSAWPTTTPMPGCSPRPAASTRPASTPTSWWCRATTRRRSSTAPEKEACWSRRSDRASYAWSPTSTSAGRTPSPPRWSCRSSDSWTPGSGNRGTTAGHARVPMRFFRGFSQTTRSGRLADQHDLADRRVVAGSAALARRRHRGDAQPHHVGGDRFDRGLLHDPTGAERLADRRAVVEDPVDAEDATVAEVPVEAAAVVVGDLGVAVDQPDPGQTRGPVEPEGQLHPGRVPDRPPAGVVDAVDHVRRDV